MDKYNVYQVHKSLISPEGFNVSVVHLLYGGLQILPTIYEKLEDAYLYCVRQNKLDPLNLVSTREIIMVRPDPAHKSCEIWWLNKCVGTIREEDDGRWAIPNGDSYDLPTQAIGQLMWETVANKFRDYVEKNEAHLTELMLKLDND